MSELYPFNHKNLKYFIFTNMSLTAHISKFIGINSDKALGFTVDPMLHQIGILLSELTTGEECLDGEGVCDALFIVFCVFILEVSTSLTGIRASINSFSITSSSVAAIRGPFPDMETI